MSGPDNLRGVDYQISYTAHRLLVELSKAERSVASFEVESLDEEAEDLNIHYRNGDVEKIQIKKKNEEYHWVPSEIKVILKKFCEKFGGGVKFAFVTNGSSNDDVKKLKDFLDGGASVSDEFLQKFCAEGVVLNNLKSMLAVTKFHTRAFSSDDDAQPAKALKDAIRNLLSSPPFLIKSDIDQALESVWAYAFDCAARASRILIEDAERIFEEKGIYIRPPVWRRFPLPGELIDRSDILSDLKSAIEKNKATLIYGISGSGKSAVLAHLASEMYDNNREVCWISVDPVTSLDDIVKAIGLALSHFSHATQANVMYQKCETDDEYAEKIVGALIDTKITVIFDSVNNGGGRIQYVVKRIITMLSQSDAKGRAVICSTDVSAFSAMAHALSENGVAPYLMPTLGREEFKQVLGGMALQLSVDELEDLREAVGGHYLSTMLLKGILANIERQSLSELRRRGALEAQSWLMNEVIRKLDNDHREFILSCSVFDYEFDIDAAEELNSSSLSASSILRNLSNLGLLHFEVMACSLHDSVQPVAYDMLSKNKKISCNEIVLNYYKNALNKLGDSEKGFPTDLIMKWGRHLEKLSVLGKHYGQSELISGLSDHQLDIIWSVHRFGFAFDYRDLNLDEDAGIDSERSESIADDEEFTFLIQQGIVKADEKRFSVGVLDTFDLLYIIYLCRNYEISDSIGYIPNFRPNYAFEKQGLICAWEHCIEFMPFPPSSRQSYIKHKEHLKRMFETGGYDDKSPQDIAMLRRMLEEPIPEDAVEGEVDKLEYGGCPVFGHCCPGGVEQARICAELDDEAQPMS